MSDRGRTALQYNQVLSDLFGAIAKYQSEYRNPAPCSFMKEKHRGDIFRYFSEIENMGKQP